MADSAIYATNVTTEASVTFHTVRFIGVYLQSYKFIIQLIAFITRSLDRIISYNICGVNTKAEFVTKSSNSAFKYSIILFRDHDLAEALGTVKIGILRYHGIPRAEGRVCVLVAFVEVARHHGVLVKFRDAEDLFKERNRHEMNE